MHSHVHETPKSSVSWPEGFWNEGLWSHVMDETLIVAAGDRMWERSCGCYDCCFREGKNICDPEKAFGMSAADLV